MSEVQYPLVQDVIETHEIMILHYGGSSGLRDAGLLESALASPRQTMFDQELYPDVVAKAAILLIGLLKNHPFIDGNKRTAFITTLRFLELNGYTISANQDEWYDFILDIIMSRIDKAAATEWIRNRGVTRSD
jgi:death-on-curing protein